MAERRQPRPADGEQELTFATVQLLKYETLGTGSYGVVCRAKCDQLICAAKLLYPILFQVQIPNPGKEHRQPFRRFEEECKFLSCVNHPNIVQYLGTYRDPDTNAPVLLMELMDESLTHFLESSPGDIPYHVQVNLSNDIAQALAYLHANGIIHRDLSSNNVLLIAGSRTKVSDFGMSRLNASRPATMTTCPGTPAFMSPEALDEPPVYTEKLDNFSFGVILVQTITKHFPDPSNRFEIQRISDRRNPAQTIEAKVPVPEVERRQAHIGLIEPTHPLLPIALECLRDKDMERPSSQQLCQSLNALKEEGRFQESSQQDVHGIIQAKQLMQEVRQAKDEQIRSLQREVQAKERALQAKDEWRQREVEAREHQLRRLYRQLQANEETAATLSHTITQRDREIAGLREIPAVLQHTITQRDREIAGLRQLLANKECEEASRIQCNEGHTAQATPTSQQQYMTWQTLPIAPVAFAQTSAVVDDRAYFKPLEGGSIWEFTSTIYQWKRLCDLPIKQGFSLVSIENQLTTVGGHYQNWKGHFKDSNKLYSYLDGKWVEQYPPMPTKRSLSMSVHTDHTLIVVGGVQSGDIVNTVEMLNTSSKQWSAVSSLPIPTAWPSVSICESHIYIHIKNTHLCTDRNSTCMLEEMCFYVEKCSLLSLASSSPLSAIWEKIASLPVRNSTLVTIKGHLLAVGGESTEGDRTTAIYQYNSRNALWQVVSQMSIPRSKCAVALLPNNNLMVVGGTPSKKKQVVRKSSLQPIEMAIVH